MDVELRKYVESVLISAKYIGGKKYVHYFTKRGSMLEITLSSVKKKSSVMLDDR